MFRYILFYKPYGVVSQFSREAKWKSLKEFGPFPASVYPVGRLDADSEGLILLTDDNQVNHRLTDPEFDHPKTYLVQVEGIPDEIRLDHLRHGVRLSGRLTRPASVRPVAGEPTITPRPVPIRVRKNIPTSWLEITLREGRNRQVRRMTAAVGHPTLRLIRTKIGPLSLGELRPGESRILATAQVRKLRQFVGLS